MLLLISDANILIDMVAGVLMDVLFRLPMQFGIPDLLYYEEIEPGSPGLTSWACRSWRSPAASWRMPGGCRASTITCFLLKAAPNPVTTITSNWHLRSRKPEHLAMAAHLLDTLFTAVARYSPRNLRRNGLLIAASS